jgi:hypothetical protein
MDLKRVGHLFLQSESFTENFKIFVSFFSEGFKVFSAENIVVTLLDLYK